MKIAWLSPYPVSQMGNLLQWANLKTSTHPCSWIMNLSRALVEDKEIELHLLTLCPWVSRTQTVERHGMFVHVIKNGIPLVHRGYPPWFKADALTGYTLEGRKIGALLDRIQPDIVHAHGTENEYALAAMRSGYPYLISMQGIVAEYKTTNPSLNLSIAEPLEVRAVKACRYFTCRTHFDTGFVRRLNSAAIIFNIPEAMSPVFWKGQWSVPVQLRVLFVGGSEPRKGLHELIETMALVVKDIPNASIDAVGNCSPERQKAFEKHAQACGVSIRFHGFKNAAELAYMHRQCRLYVLCSSNENSPNALAEAMVSGMPVVAYNVGGVSSMVEDEVTGLLVKRREISGLATAITRVLKDSTLAEALGGNAARLARVRHEPHHVAKETLVAYRYILNDAAKSVKRDFEVPKLEQ